jgi:SAM-dependent methyltransferase
VSAFVPVSSYYREQLAKHGSDLLMDCCDETSNADAYSCPHCDASDRDRLYSLFLERQLAPDPGRAFKLLDIGPSQALSAHIRRRYRISYKTADLLMEGADLRVDLTDMRTHADNSVDAFICSHVLEHVRDDRKAMGELFRVLVPGGWGIPRM